jgi:hypothetical protein
MVNRQLERQQMNRERRMAEDEQFQKVRLVVVYGSCCCCCCCCCGREPEISAPDSVADPGCSPDPDPQQWSRKYSGNGRGFGSPGTFLTARN